MPVVFCSPCTTFAAGLALLLFTHVRDATSAGETFMDYDENIFDMPNVGKRPGDGCPLADRVAEAVTAYNMRRAELVEHDKSTGPLTTTPASCLRRQCSRGGR